MKRISSTFFVLLSSISILAQETEHPSLEATRVYSADERPQDWRLGELKDLDGYFPMEVPDSKEAWAERAEAIRRRILVSCGLWPMPERPIVKPTIHGKVDRGEYTVERVYFESYPGLFVTGSLYRPKGKQGPFPVVLSPHGHFSNGRFHQLSDEELGRALESGGERLEIGGRYPLQARCVQLARMGCMVFFYDMLGYADSKQISQALAHGHSEPRPEMENANSWGLFTAQAEMRLQNVFGMQTFNSLRAVDFVAGLPDVDPSRIAVTGASGGGTQTMMLAALEPRVAVSFPAVMVSTAMQGGCTCENATCLRVDTGNIEFAGLFAPKPQGITYADDWTRELLTKGLPALRRLYKLYDAEPLVEADWRSGGRRLDLTYFGHNYNNVSRAKMYHWLNKHLRLGYEGTPKGFIVEKEFEPLTVEEMTVWNDDHPVPPLGEEFETQFLRELSDNSDNTMMKLVQSASAFRTVVQPALETLLNANWDDIGIAKRNDEKVKIDAGDYWLFRDKLSEDERELPTIFLHPKEWNREVVIWASGRGKVSLVDELGVLRDEVSTLLDNGFSVIGVDLYQQGELRTGGELKETRKVANPRDFAGYTFGYNRTLIGNQVLDLLTVLKMIGSDDHGTEKIHMIGIEGAGPHVILAKALAGKHVDKLAIDDGDFRFRNVKSWRDPNFLPGAIKYGDFPAMIGLGGESPTWVGTKNTARAQAAQLPYNNLGAKPVFQETQNATQDAVDWLVN